jgi:hypothetical protein
MAEQERYGDWQQTFTGRKVWPLDFREQDVSVVDIVHSLSMICRFGGHTRHFYSVAEHSGLVALEVLRRTNDAVMALQGLFHDAAEAYIGDMCRPMKRCAEFEAYRGMEENIRAVIFYKLDIGNGILPEVVDDVDNELLDIEAKQLMTHTRDWSGLKTPNATFKKNIGQLKCLEPHNAKDFFYRLHRRLNDARKNPVAPPSVVGREF